VAYALRDANREGAPFLDTDQREGQEGHAWPWRAVPTGTEPIEARGGLACVGDHHGIAGQARCPCCRPKHHHP
jgi:hypothetical protein